MKSQQQIEELRDIMGAMVELSADGSGPFDPKMLDAIAAIWNALCFILEDGSPHAEAFGRNWGRTMEWCAENGVRFVKFDPTIKQ